MTKNVAVLCMAWVFPVAAATVPPSKGSDAAPSRYEVRVETFATRDGGALERCQVAQVWRGGPLESWSTFGEARPGASGGLEIIRPTCRCKEGRIPGPTVATTTEKEPAALLTLEMTVRPSWDPGAMDPGPVPVIQLAVDMASRRLTGFSPDGKTQYTERPVDKRTIRVGEGEEFVWPVLLADAHERELLGVDAVFVRIRAGGASRPGATQYGALGVIGASPGSEILLDGGAAGRAAADGTFFLSGVPVGEREIRVNDPTGRSASRFVTVVKGRAVVVSPDASRGAGPGKNGFTSEGDNAQGFTEFRRARDGAIMVRIPAGEFLMGNLETEGQPQPHTVNVAAFLMDKLPVTWGRFKLFAAATGWPLPPEPYWGIHDDHPVDFVRWDEGRAYCEWAGARLPTEAEREKAARGTDGRKFPWGNDPPTPERGVFRRNWGHEGTDSVGIRPDGASPYGLLDTGGNVWEWCEDWYDSGYYGSSPTTDPMGPATGRAHVVRGGSWDSRPTVLSSSCRNWGYVGYREGDFGFRCAADPPR